MLRRAGWTSTSWSGWSEAGAPIDLFGVGTKAGVSADAPWSDMAYKLVCYNGRPVMKLSTDKESPPGAKQVFPYAATVTAAGPGMWVALADEKVAGAEGLLSTAMTEGRLTAPSPTLEEIRGRFKEDWHSLDSRFKALVGPPQIPGPIQSEATTVDGGSEGTTHRLGTVSHYPEAAYPHPFPHYWLCKGPPMKIAVCVKYVPVVSQIQFDYEK